MTKVALIDVGGGYRGIYNADIFDYCLDNVLIVAPDDTCGVDTLTKDVEALNKLYNKGYKDGTKIKAFMKK